MSPNKHTKKAIVFDMDETLGSFVQLGMFTSVIENNLHRKLTNEEFNIIMDLFPLYQRPNIIPILNYIKKKKQEQNEIDLHENYILQIEDKVTKLKKKLESEKLSNELTNINFEKCKKENSLFKNRTQCVICKSNDRTILFLPCKHCVCCRECSISLYTNKCPTCRGDITERQTIFLS